MGIKKRRYKSDVLLTNGRGSWTRTNACRIQKPVPYQLGDTPILLTYNIILVVRSFVKKNLTNTWDLFALWHIDNANTADFGF